MKHIVESIIASAWNRPRQRPRPGRGVVLGRVVDLAGAGPASVLLADRVRTEHVAVLGKTGTGKSSLLRQISAQDIKADRGFVHFDLHGETTPHVLSLLAAEERRRRMDLSDRVIVIDPTDAGWAVGLNVLDADTEADRFRLVSEVTQILRQRWGLDSLGARTEELLRNALLVLSECRLTLLDLSALLTDAVFRTQCLRNVTNSEAITYFATRYDAGSDAMQGTWRDAVLNKVSAFTADPHFRHLLGQVESTISLVDAMDRGCWILLNLHKGRLGEHAATLGSLFLTRLKTALFARRSRSLFTFYLDELQNLVAYDSGIDTLLSEARKFGIGICSANQFLDQYPPSIRSAILSVGTHILFQLSAGDADRMAAALNGHRPLQELLKELPHRHAVIRAGHDHWRHVAVPEVLVADTDGADLRERSLARWARRRTDVEAQIKARHVASAGTAEALHDWE